MEERNDIVIYKSEDGLVKMEAMVDPVNETIWASQKAIAALLAAPSRMFPTIWVRYLRAASWIVLRLSKKF
jgi:hypothetical protein